MIDNKTIYQVDAFSEEPFKGNTAGVMIVDKDITTEWMQNMALEMNLSETAFITPQDNKFEIRYFTPLREVPLCGHATLASAHILYELGIVKQNETIFFKAKGADLEIKKDSSWIIMNFPKYPLIKIDTPPGFNKTIGFEPTEVYSSLYGWIVAVGMSENEILNSKPNFDIMNSQGLGFLMITAKSESKNIDFVVRCFGPILGVNEDPATGSAHCALTPLWSDKLNKLEMNSFQLSKRTGTLKVKLIDDRVEIKGKAVTIFKAQLKI
jgi:PhzF family phenazine biosynthesis protein